MEYFLFPKFLHAFLSHILYEFHFSENFKSKTFLCDINYFQEYLKLLTFILKH